MADDEILNTLRDRIAAGRPTDSPHSPTPPPGPAPQRAVGDAEQIIGYQLPPLARRIYREIANGGVGPFGGIEGVRGGHASDYHPMLDTYLDSQGWEPDPDDPPMPPLPAGVLFFCDFGCGMWSLLDCRHPDGQMWWWEEGDRYKLDLTLPQWFATWLTAPDSWPSVHQAPGGTPPQLIVADESWTQPYED